MFWIYAKRLAIILFFVFSPALAEETLFLITTGGDSCGAGDDELLAAIAGASDTSKTLDGTGDNWDIVEVRVIASGNWQVCTDIDVAGGGGQASRVTWLVQHFNSSCVQQGSDIINEQSGNLTSGSANEVCSSLTDPGKITFASGDLIVVVLSHTQGSRLTEVQYNNSTAAWDSRIIHPDEFVASNRGPITIY